MNSKPTVVRAVDPAVIAGVAKATQQQHQHPHHPAPPSHLSRMLAIGIWLAFIGTLVAVFYTNR